MPKTAKPSRLETIRVAGNASDTIRPLGSFEHIFWLIDQNRSIHFTVTAQIAGKVSPDEWREALECVQKRHPLLSVCIDGNPGSNPRFRQVHAAPIPLRVVDGNPKASWEAEVGGELATPFDPSRAPLIRAVLIHGDQDTAFTLVAHHSIADGLSVAYAIRDTLSALSGGLLEPLPLSPSQQEILGGCTGPAAVPSSRRQRVHAPGNPATYRPLDDARPTVKALGLGPALTANLRDRARREGTTVHGALCAALAIAGRQVCADWQKIPLRIASPVSTRQLLDVGESCGLFIGAAIGVIDKHAICFWKLARDAKAVIAPAQTRDSLAVLLSAFDDVVGNGAGIITAAHFIAAAFAHEATLTNLGVLNFDSWFGPLKLEALWGPAVLLGMEGEQTIGVATVNGSICLTHTGYAPPEGLLEVMRSVLVDACQ